MSSSSTYFVQRKHFPVDRSPRMLKDFLIDDSNSYSSSGFKSFPRKPTDSGIRTLIEIDLNARNSNSNNGTLLFKSRSKAASTTISTLQAMINAVKSIPFTAVKSPSILPRSLSRRLSKKSTRKSSENKENEVKIKVTIKDIIRWQSFQGLADEKFPSLDLASSPHHCTTTTTTTTGSTTSTPCNSNGSSWCDSDFTSESLPCWNGDSEAVGENEAETGEKNLPFVGEDSLEATTEKRTTYTSVGPKGDPEEDQQCSTVSVIDFEFEEDEESINCSFDQSLASVDRTKQKLMQNIRRFEGLAKVDPVIMENWMSLDQNISSGDDDDEEEGRDPITSYNGEEEEAEEEDEGNEIEEKAWQLLNHVKVASSMGSCKNHVDQVLLDFFRHELTTKTYLDRNEEFDFEMFIIAKAWINGEHSLWIRWGVEQEREAYVRDMDRGGKWSKFEEEQEELVVEIEDEVIGFLVDELFNLISC